METQMEFNQISSSFILLNDQMTLSFFSVQIG